MGQTIWLHVMQSNVSNLLHSFYNISIDAFYCMYYNPFHFSRSVGKCFMEMKMALCTELTTEEAGDGELGVEEYRDIIACTIGMECT